MKRILFFIAILFSLNAFSQSTVLLRGDTIKVYKQGGDAVLKVEGHLMLKDYRQGNSNDSVLTWDATTKKVRMMDRNSFAGGSTPTLQQVTGADSITNHRIRIDNVAGDPVIYLQNAGYVGTIDVLNPANSAGVSVQGATGSVQLSNAAGFTGRISPTDLTANHYYELRNTGNGNDTLATLYDVRAGGGGGGTGSNLSWDAANHQVDIDGGGTSATIPYATTATDGLISSSSQTIDGAKTFNNGIVAPSISDASALFNLHITAGQGDLSLSNGSATDHIRPQASSSGSSNRLPNTGNVADTLATLYDIRAGGGGGGYTNLTQFVAQNNWKIFHSDGSGDVQELSLGAAGSPFYSVGTSSTPAFFAGVTYATSGTNVKITTQNTTDVGLEIKLASSQTANALNISSSSGTGDLAIIDAAGASRFTSEIIGTASARKIELFANGEALFTSDATASIYDPDAFDNTTQIYGSGNARLLVSSGSGYDHSLVAVTGNLFGVYSGFVDGGGIGMETNNALNLITNKVTRLTITSAGAITVPEQAASATPGANNVTIYPKSDGLWYGKDDAGVETKLSNDAGGTPTFQQVLTAGSTLSGSNTVNINTSDFTFDGTTGGLRAITSNSIPITARYSAASTNTIATVLSVQRFTSGSAASGIGSRIEFPTSNSSGVVNGTEIISKLTAVTATAETSQTLITGVSKGVIDTTMALGGYVTLTESSATKFTSTTIASGKIQGGSILITIESNDATDYQSRTLRFIWSAVNKAGTLTITLSTPEEVVALSSGTLTCTITAVDAGSGVLDFKANAVSSLTQTTLRATYQTFKNF